MADDLSAAIERLRTSTQRLNSISDAAGRLVKEVEEFLENSHVGVSCSVKLGYIADPDDPESFEAVTRLAYGRTTAGRFRIGLLVIPREAQAGDVDLKPWSECSRDEKIEMLGGLPELLIALADRANEKVDKAEQAMAAVSSLMKLQTQKGGK